MAAYGLARFRFFGRKTVAYTSLLLRTVPLAVLAVPVFMIWGQAGMINSLWGLILLYVAVNLPFAIWLLYGFILQVPIELEEAASIDGCGPIKVFWKVVLPLIKPGMHSGYSPLVGTTTGCSLIVPSFGSEMRTSSPFAARSMSSSRWSLACASAWSTGGA